MTGPVTALVPERRVRRAADTERAAALRAALRPEFLHQAGWRPDSEVLAPPRSHRQFGLAKCVVPDCEAGVRTQVSRGLCQGCERRFRASGLALEQFVSTPSGKRGKGERSCRVPGCGRVSGLLCRLCPTHESQWRRKHPDLTAEQFAMLPGLKPFPSFGPCQVHSCVRSACWRGWRLCAPHKQRWYLFRRDYAELGLSLQDWLPIAEPINVDHFVIFKGLPERVQLELLVGLQARTDAGYKTELSAIRALVRSLRAQQVAALGELEETSIKHGRRDAQALLRTLVKLVRRAVADPNLERVEDVWDLAVFGLRGSIKFTGISQPWLRETSKRWVEHDLPLHRGRGAHSSAKAVVAAVAELSESLRLTRADQGEHPADLGRRDILALTNRLAFKERTGVITPRTRVSRIRRLRQFLADIRPLGFTKDGGPAEGLAEDFVLARADVPAEPDPDDTGRALPEWVLAIINANLEILQRRSGVDCRRLAELMIDTGRRPDELCQLPWTCLERDSNDKPVLVYTDSKNHRSGRRLPINEATAQIVLDQQAHARTRFPDMPVNKLALFPRETANPDGAASIPEETFCAAHRAFVNAIAHLLVREVLGEDGRARTEVFDRLAVIPYAYRHSYAQRHADQGVAPDVLRDLMGHAAIQTTAGYYRVTEKRIRQAVDRVSDHQFDATGNRVFRGISGLLAHEHARMRVGQVAVPFGICTEPSNVKAGGQACPYKFTCLGCGHFRSDPSYLPELKSYLQQLLADRECLQAATDIDDWARAKLSPSDHEISKLRGLIRRIETDLDDLAAEDQQHIAEAVMVLRKTRQVVNLGMPAVQPPATDAG